MTGSERVLDFGDFRRRTAPRKKERRPDAEMRERLSAIRPDVDGSREPESGEEARRTMRLRLRLLGHLGDAFLAGLSQATDVGLGASYEVLYRLANAENPEDPKQLDPVADPMGAAAVIDTGILAAAGILLRMVRSAANPGTDGPREQELFAGQKPERLAYFRKLLPPLSEAIAEVDTLLNAQIPGYSRYLDLRDAALLLDSAPEAEEEAASYIRQRRRESTESAPLMPPQEEIEEAITETIRNLFGPDVTVEVLSRIAEDPADGPDVHQDGESGESDPQT